MLKNPSTGNSHSHRIREELPAVLAFMAVMWLIFFADRILPLELLGLMPRHIQGLLGIVTMPFLHKDFSHIISNTVPLMVFLSLLAGCRANSRYVVINITLLSGLLLWLFGRDAIHIGASALVFGLALFLIVSGFIERRTIPLIISIVLIITYGSSLFIGMLPLQPGVSWEGHLFGAVSGSIMAFLMVKRQA